MATRTFLTADQLKEAGKILRPPMSPPNGRVLLDHSLTSALDFSSWLSLSIENRLRELPGWEEASPIAVGSWGRGELCPGSDLDVIFCGNKEAVRKVVTVSEEQGMKLRYRMPEDPEDWTVGVEVLELHALFNAKAFTEEGAEKLQVQKNLIEKNGKGFRRKLLQAIARERRARVKRYDSIANFLEPDLKFGAGGLRDLEQALVLAQWFSERFEDGEYSFKVLSYYKCLFLLLRQKMHLQHSHDKLTGPDQHDLVEWFGFKDHRNFMAEVQKGLARVSFHSDWTIERCGLSQKDLKHFANLQLSSWKEAQKSLFSDPRTQTLAAIRQSLYLTNGFKKEKLKRSQKGKLLKKLLDIRQKEEITDGAFRSHIVAHLVPDFTKVIGLVQHDQYHRFSVDAHLLQAVREVKRVYEHPKLLGKLEYFGEKLKLTDWNMLRWAALYHDMGKGQKGEHSLVGAELAKKDLRLFGFPKDFVTEVVWLVENHLILSTAAFRKNPQSPKTWEYLYSRGVKGQRLYRLAIFTVIDIIATNPEAWNSWKGNLLCEMVDTLRNPSQERHYNFSQKVKRKLQGVPDNFINALDAELIESVSQQVLIKDFSAVLSEERLSPLIFRDKKGLIWVRFFEPKDRSGLVLDFTQRLTGIGCNIRQAFIQTHPVMGVYDWFCVKTQKTPNVIKKQLSLNPSVSQNHNASFSQIDLVSKEEDEWVFSFRAKDKKGLLLTALQSLHDLNLDLTWAKVHTWGRQIDDVVGIKPSNIYTAEKVLEKLQEQLVVKELNIL